MVFVIHRNITKKSQIYVLFYGMGGSETFPSTPKNE